MDTDRNLLFAVLALQADLIDGQCFVKACTLWTARKGTPIADVLIEQGWLTAEGRGVVEQLMEFKLRRHFGDVHASLAAAADPEVRSALASVADRDVEQSLATLEGGGSVTPNGNTRPVVDPFATAPPAESAGRNVIYEEIGRGGMGRVLRGRDPGLRRELAVKVLRVEYSTNAEVERRFVEEAQIAGQLQHPGIVPVYELGEFKDGRPFFTMKLVKGRTLADLLRERSDLARDQGHYLAIFERICQTMAYAHSKGVIHRDLKPGNIMVGVFGEVLVMDWGLAKVRQCNSPPAAETPGSGTVIRTARTDSTEGENGHTGVVGTPAFMAPEQARGDTDVDERADVFGLGGVLCVLLTGHPPHVAPNHEEVMRRAAQGDLSEAFGRLVGSGADSELVTLCKECLAECRDARPRDAAEVSARVTAYLAGVRDRLRKTELERAAAEALALEEQKRRRMMARVARVGFASSVLLLILALLALFASRKVPPQRLFLDRSASVEARLGAIPRLPLDDEGVMSRVFWGLRGETDPALVVPALGGLADRVAEGQIPSSVRESFVALLQGLLADFGLKPDIHRAAFTASRRVGRPAEVVAGTLAYLHSDAPQPLEGEFLAYLASPEAATAYHGDAAEPVHTREALLRRLRSLADHRQGDTRTAALALFAREAPAPLALEVAAAQYRAAPLAEEPGLRGVLASSLGRLDLASLDDATRLDVVWQIAELIRRPGQPDEVVSACVGLLDRLPTAALCEALYKVYTNGKGVDGNGAPPEGSQAADVILLPYARRTRKDGRLAEIQGYILVRLQDLLAGRGDDDLADSATLPYLLGAVSGLRGVAGKPWPEGRAALAQVLARYGELDRSVLPLLLGSLVVLGNDGPAPFADFEPIRRILMAPQMPMSARAAAAAALGGLHDVESVALLKNLASGRDNRSVVRVAAVQALGALGAFQKSRGQPTAELAAYLTGVLEQRGREPDSAYLQAVVGALGPIIDPARPDILFDVLCESDYVYAALHGLQTIMAGEAACRQVVAAYLAWRAKKGDGLVASPFLHPDELFLGGPAWSTWKPDMSEVEKVMKVVAPALAEANLSADAAVRQVAAKLRQALLKTAVAPPLDPAADEPARKAQLRRWEQWWDGNRDALHLRGESLSRG
jgi:hypothetical protein